MLLERYRLRKHTHSGRQSCTFRGRHKVCGTHEHRIALYNVNYSLCRHPVKVDHPEERGLDLLDVFLSGYGIEHPQLQVIPILHLSPLDLVK